MRAVWPVTSFHLLTYSLTHGLQGPGARAHTAQGLQELQVALTLTPTLAITLALALTLTLTLVSCGAPYLDPYP